MAETILLTATSIVLVVSIFYPQIVGLMKNVLEVMSVWFENATAVIGAI